jgi:hypothetical protein
MFVEIVVAASASFLIFAGKDLHRLFTILIHPFFSPLRSLRSPPIHGFFQGNDPDVENADPSILHEKWVQEYGPVFNFKAAVGVRRTQLFRVAFVAYGRCNTLLDGPSLRRRRSRGFAHHKQQRRLSETSGGPERVK